MSLFKINGVDLPTPSDIQPSIIDITNEETNAQGFTLIELIATKRSFQVSYNYLSADDMSKVLIAIKPVSFEMTYLDPETNTYKTGLFKKSNNRSMGLLTFINGVPTYKDLKIDFVER